MNEQIRRHGNKALVLVLVLVLVLFFPVYEVLESSKHKTKQNPERINGSLQRIERKWKGKGGRRRYLNQRRRRHFCRSLCKNAINSSSTNTFIYLFFPPSNAPIKLIHNCGVVL